MKINLDDNREPFTISAYAEGWIRIADRRIEQPCIVSAHGVDTAELPASLDALQVSHFGGIVDLAPEIVLLGTGARQVFVDWAITDHLASVGIALETMDTGAACRSFNILLAESRPVVAALYMI
jgi:uncharacterized protein